MASRRAILNGTDVANNTMLLGGRQLGVAQTSSDGSNDMAISFAAGAEWIISATADQRIGTNATDILDTF
jgi:hypothetical protein